MTRHHLPEVFLLAAVVLLSIGMVCVGLWLGTEVQS